VVNAAASISGRYPNEGPLLLAAARVPVLDSVGVGVLDGVREGQTVRIDGDSVFIGDRVVAQGTRQTLASLEQSYEAAKTSLDEELGRFAENTLEYLRNERHLVLEPSALPDVDVDFRNRQVMVVVRGADYRDDLLALRSYINEMRPVLIAVDGGADALLEAKLKPDIIVGDFDSVSTHALTQGARLIVHAYPGGKAPGAERLDQLGLPYTVLESVGTSEDVALLLAYEKHADLIVAVGTHASMVDFLDKGREGMASTFLTRLKVGTILMDAKGVSQLYQAPVRKRDLIFLVASAMSCLVVMIIVFPPLRVFAQGFWVLLQESWRSLRH
jgi:uncharacterized membrane-anchored protein